MGLGLEPERDLLDLDRERERGDLDLECQRSLEYERLLDRDLQNKRFPMYFITQAAND